MKQIKTVMDVFKLLNKSNCGKCNEKTCLAFAAAVFKNEKSLNECPALDGDVISQYSQKVDTLKKIEDEYVESLDKLKQKISEMDFSEAAARVGGKFENSRLTIKVFGKDVNIHRDGSLSSDIHINPWITLPIFMYLLNCRGVPITDKWVPFRELTDAMPWNNFFNKQCIQPIKEVADTYTELFEDLVHLFNGKKIDADYNADISVALYPLPKIPMLISYWKPEDDLESDLNLFFNSSAVENSSIEAIYGLGAGIARMFQKLALRHGVS